MEVARIDHPEREELITQLHRCESILANHQILVVQTDLRGKYTYVSSYFCQVYGTDVERAIGTHSLDWVDESDWQKCRDAVNKCLEDVHQMVEVVLGKTLPGNDRRLEVKWQLSAILDTQKEVVGILGQGCVLSQEMLRRERLAKSEAQFRFIAENTSDGIMVFEYGKPIYASPAYQRILGYQEDEESKRTIENVFELIHPEDRERVQQVLMEKMANREPLIVYEFRALHKAGHYVWREDRANILYDEAGQPAKAVLIARDITERKQAEMDLLKSQEQLRSTLASMEDLVFTMDGKGYYQEYYQPINAGELLAAPDQFLNRHYRDTLPSFLAQLVDEVYRKFEHSHETQVLEYHLDINGKRQWYSAKASMRRDSKGSFSGITVVAQNITKQNNPQKR